MTPAPDRPAPDQLPPGTTAAPTAVQDSDPHRYASVALLIDLVTNTLDPGYAEATERRSSVDGGQATGRWGQLALATACLLLGLLLAVAYVTAHRGAFAAKQVQSRLVQQVRSADSTANSLTSEAAKIESDLEQIRRAALPGDERGQLSRAELAAGLVAVTGPGIVVTLGLPDTTAAPSSSADSTSRAGTTPITSTSLINDRDVRSVVNELWADGAEAISVNNVRLTPTSAIRFAGQAVLVDFQPLLPPYVMRAIGNRGAMITSFANSAVASRYQTLITARGITFTFTESGKLDLPAATENALRYARALPSGAPVSATSTGSPAATTSGTPTR